MSNENGTPQWNTASWPISSPVQTVDYFYLKHANGKYLSPLFPKLTSSSSTATTAFALGADAEDTTHALICATVQLASSQGAQHNTLLVWINAHDPHPKAICMDTGMPLRVYFQPAACTTTCEHAWQACNPTTLHCDDAHRVSRTKTTASTAASSPSDLAFPNCVSRQLIALTEVSASCQHADNSASNASQASSSSSPSSDSDGTSSFKTALLYIEIAVAALLVIVSASLAIHFATRTQNNPVGANNKRNIVNERQQQR